METELRLKTHGSIELVGDQWHIKADGYVMIRLKNALPKVEKSKLGEVTLKHSPEACFEIFWITQRFPMEIKSSDDLLDGVDAYHHNQKKLQDIRENRYEQRDIEGMVIPARKYQLEAVEVLMRMKSLLLGDQLGLGKSITAIAGIAATKALPALIVCQTHLCRQWQGFFKQFMPSLKVQIIRKGYQPEERYACDKKDKKPYRYKENTDVLICTYGKLFSWAEILAKRVRFVCFDEVQELRHRDTEKYNGAREVVRGVEYKIGLSATPIYGFGGELFSIFEILSPGTLGSLEEFKREWCEHTYGGKDKLKDPDAFGMWLRDEFMFLQRTRQQVGKELPPVNTIVEVVEHDEDAMKEIDTIATELAHRILKKGGSFHDKGEAAREFDLKLRQQTGIAKAPFVAAFVSMIVSGGEKVVLCGWHRAVYTIWMKIFETQGIKYVLYTGTESPKQKDDAKKAFVTTDIQVFIISNRSGAGLDGLQKASSVIVHGELDFSPAVHDQLTGRLNRDGQDESVSEFYLVSDAGSDPVIAEILGLKRQESDGIINPGVKTLQKLQTDEGRLKRMAEYFLEQKGVKKDKE